MYSERFTVELCLNVFRKVHSGVTFECIQKGWIAEEVMVELGEQNLGQSAGCSSKVKENAGYRCFQESLNRESENSELVCE